MSKRLEKLQQQFTDLIAKADQAQKEIEIEASKVAKREEEKAAKKAELDKFMSFVLINNEWKFIDSRIVNPDLPKIRAEKKEIDGFLGYKIVGHNLPKIVPVFQKYIAGSRYYNKYFFDNGYKIVDGNFIKQ